MPHSIRPQSGTSSREEQLLAHWHATRDTRARDELVTIFTPAARNLARRYSRGREPFEDLTQVATLGLVKALDRYEPDRGPAFMAFAVPTIVGELRRYFRDCGWSVHVPRAAKERALKVRDARTRLSSELGREPDVEEIARELQLDLEETLDALYALQSFEAASLDAEVKGGEGDSERYVDLIGSVDENFELVELDVAARGAIRHLEPSERRLLRLRFVDELTQREIADRTGVSQMHVSRSLRRTIERVRAIADPA